LIELTLILLDQSLYVDVVIEHIKVLNAARIISSAENRCLLLLFLLALFIYVFSQKAHLWLDFVRWLVIRV
jgi:hypothetical protein